jgi:YD repeat-containing protein
MYIRDRLATSTVTDGTKTVTLVTNTYDQPFYSCGGSGFGFLTTSVTPTGTSTYTYDSYGNLATAANNGLSTNVTMDSTHNYAVPSSIVTGSNSQAMQWNAFLGLTQNTGQNGDAAQIGYDSSGRVSSSTSPYGAVTGYTYVNYTSASSPATVTATTNAHFTRQTLDGLGRTVKAEAGTYNGTTYTTTSVVDTQYAPCGCSPLGKVSAVSQPHAPGGTVYWTNYHYDWQGRTTSVVLPDNSTTTYVYDDRVTGTDPAASFVTITDAAGKKKRFQMDGLGHLTQVTEDPAGLKYVTTYAYDVLEHRIRPTNPGQTRAVDQRTGVS